MANEFRTNSARLISIGIRPAVGDRPDVWVSRVNYLDVDDLVSDEGLQEDAHEAHQSVHVFVRGAVARLDASLDVVVDELGR